MIRNGLTVALRRLQSLRRSVLLAAFSGQLVPQDPSDEPASVLLERIAAERAASKPSRKEEGGIVTDSKAARRQAVELLQRPARRRVVVRRLRRAAHLPAVPEDVRRAAPARPAEHRPRGARLAVAAEAVGRGAGGALHQDPQRAGHHRRHARRDLPQGAEPHPGPGQAAAADPRPDRRRDVDGPRRRHQGRRLRGPARTQRRRHQVRGRAVLHAAGADLGDGRRDAADART